MVYKSPYPLLDIPEKNILSYLFPKDKPVLDEAIWIDSRDPSRSLSPNQALQWVKRLAFGLQRLGLQGGDVAMILTPNHIFVPVAYLGIVGAGLVFSGANPAYTVPGRSSFLPSTPESTCALTFPLIRAHSPDGKHHLGSIPLSPVAHGLPLDLSARKLGHLVDEDHAPREVLVLGHACFDPFLEVLWRYLALRSVLDDDVRTWPFLSVSEMRVLAPVIPVYIHLGRQRQLTL